MKKKDFAAKFAEVCEGMFSRSQFCGAFSLFLDAPCSVIVVSDISCGEVAQIRKKLGHFCMFASQHSRVMPERLDVIELWFTDVKRR